VTAFYQEEHEIGIFKTTAVGEAAALAELAYCVENDMVDPEGEDPEANAKFTAKAKKLVRQLRMPGVVFAYDASGQGWGGMPITILLAIDTKTKTKKVHAITMQCHAYHD
jgi:hypothetical protein